MSEILHLWMATLLIFFDDGISSHILPFCLHKYGLWSPFLDETFTTCFSRSIGNVSRRVSAASTVSPLETGSPRLIIDAQLKQYPFRLRLSNMCQHTAFLNCFPTVPERGNERCQVIGEQFCTLTQCSAFWRGWAAAHKAVFVAFRWFSLGIVIGSNW